MAEVKTDFGQKIGGARKDLWSKTGLSVEDLSFMNDEEKAQLVKKDNVWKKPNYEKMRNEGYEKEGLHYIKYIRDSVITRTKPNVTHEAYVTSIKEIEKLVLNIHSFDEAVDFYQQVEKSSTLCEHLINAGIDPYCTNPYSFDAKRRMNSFEKRQLFFNELDRANAMFPSFSQYDVKLDRENIIGIKKQGWGGTFYFRINEDLDISKLDKTKNLIIDSRTRMVIDTDVDSNDLNDKVLSLLKEIEGNSDSQEVEKTTNRKKRMSYSVLENVSLTGVNYRNGIDITGDDILSTFNIRGGEFGNWLNERDAQLSLNHAYDSFMNIAAALEIDPRDVSLGGKLAIAFGARGLGAHGGIAHYEPAREVINLTKMKGAGSLAHEWIHAQDNIFGKDIMERSVFLSEEKKYRNEKLPDSIVKLNEAMLHKNLKGEDAIEFQKSRMDEAKETFMKELNSVCWKTDYTEEQKIKLNELRQNVVKELDEGERYRYQTFSFETRKYIKDNSISEATKELMDYQLSAGDKGLKANIKYINYKREIYSTSVHNYKSSLTEDTTINVKTDFYENAKKLDQEISKTSNGYWSSNVEMLARAGASYISDKLKEHNISDPYLVGHSELTYNDIPLSPRGEEREEINKAFDDYFSDMKERGLLHHMDYEKVIDMKLEYTKPIFSDFNIEPYQETTQLSFDDIFADNGGDGIDF